MGTGMTGNSTSVVGLPKGRGFDYRHLHLEAHRGLFVTKTYAKVRVGRAEANRLRHWQAERPGRLQLRSTDED